MVKNDTSCGLKNGVADDSVLRSVPVVITKLPPPAYYPLPVDPELSLLPLTN